MEKIYKALFVKKDTHRLLAVEAKKNGYTFDKYVLLLLKLWKQNSRSKNK